MPTVRRASMSAWARAASARRTRWPMVVAASRRYPTKDALLQFLCLASMEQFNARRWRHRA